MTDIERLRALAKTEAQIGQCNDTCLYQNTGCAVLALIERLEKAEAERDKAVEDELEKAEAQRDRLADALREIIYSEAVQGIKAGDITRAIDALHSVTPLGGHSDGEQNR